MPWSARREGGIIALAPAAVYRDPPDAAPIDATTQQHRNTMLDADQLACWQRDGCLVLPGFKAAAELAAMRERSQAIVEAFEPGSELVYQHASFGT